MLLFFIFFFSSRRRHTRYIGDWSSDVCSSDLLFPWTMSDFSLMDAIECGIVKLPRVPVAENIPGDEMPMFRKLWDNIRKEIGRASCRERVQIAEVAGA